MHLLHTAEKFIIHKNKKTIMNIMSYTKTLEIYQQSKGSV
jgi:hypothetical protein